MNNHERLAREAINRRERQEKAAVRSEHAEAEKRTEEIKREVKSTIPRALGHLATLGYPDAVMIQLEKPANPFQKFFSGSTRVPAESVPAWHLFEQDAGKGGYDKFLYDNYYLTTMGEIVVKGDYSYSQSETSGNPRVLEALQDILQKTE